MSSWLPTWPANAPDIQAYYESMVPKQYPKGLYKAGGEATKDQQAIARVLSWARKATWWLMHRFHPQNDPDGYLLAKWELDAGFASTGTIAERRQRILASLRNRGTGTDTRLKAVFSQAFDGDNALSFSASTINETWASLLNWQHVVPDPTRSVTLRSVHGHDKDTVWIVGNDGKIWLSNFGIEGRAWTEKASGTANHLYGVHGKGPSSAWAVGDVGTIRAWNGAVWAAGPAGGPAVRLNSVSAPNSADWWVCGENGWVGRYDGSAWSNSQPEGVGYKWLSVHAYSPTDVVFCGNQTATGDGYFLEWHAATGFKKTLVCTEILHCVRKISGDKIYVVGENGKAYKYGGSSWASMTVPAGFTEHLYGLDGWAENRLLAVGADGSILRFDGSAWVRRNSATTKTLRSVFIDPRSVFAWTVGLEGTAIRAPDPLNAGEVYAHTHGRFHIYHTTQTQDVDRRLADDLIVKCQPVHQEWYAGMTGPLLWGAGKWSESTWGK